MVAFKEITAEQISPPFGGIIDIGELADELGVSRVDNARALGEAILVAENLLDGAGSLTGRALMRQKWLLSWRRFPKGMLPIIPIIQPLKRVCELAYVLTGHRLPFPVPQSSFFIRNGLIWPKTSWDDLGVSGHAVSLTIEAGCDDASELPEAVKNAYLLIARAAFGAVCNNEPLSYLLDSSAVRAAMNWHEAA